MKKLLVCLIFMICIIYIYPTCWAIGDGDNVKKEDCLKRKVEGDSAAVTGHTPDTCCYSEESYTFGGQKVSESGCLAFEKSKVEDYLKSYKKQWDLTKKAYKALGYGDINFDLDCSSSYIKFGLMDLILILF